MSLLAQEPELPAVTLADLLGVAAAMESEAVRLYAALETAMSRQGADEVAAVFHRLVAMEQLHVGAVAAFGQSLLGRPVPAFAAGEAGVWSRVVAPAAAGGWGTTEGMAAPSKPPSISPGVQPASSLTCALARAAASRSYRCRCSRKSRKKASWP